MYSKFAPEFLPYLAYQDNFIIDKNVTDAMAEYSVYALGCTKEDVNAVIEGNELIIDLPFKFYFENKRIKLKFGIDNRTDNVHIKVENGVAKIQIKKKPLKSIKINVD